jgi:hypothetical protein
MQNYADFKGLILSKIDLNSLGLNIPYVDKVVQGSDLLRNKLLKDLESSIIHNKSQNEKSVIKMKIELPKIKTKFPIEKTYGRVSAPKVS